MASVSAVVVSFNNEDTINQCVESIRNQVEQIIVVDNRSSDNTLDQLLEIGGNVEVVRSPKNVGYGRAVNSGARFVTGEHVLILNADVIVGENAVKEMSSVFYDNENVAIVGPVVNNSDGSRFPSPRKFPSLLEAAGHAFVGLFRKNNRWSSSYTKSNESPVRSDKVDWVSGSCFLIRKNAFDELGGFDERYFLYMEDVDLCYRAHQKGWNVSFDPEAVVVHHQGISTSKRKLRSLLTHHISMAKYAASTMTGAQRVLLPFVWLGIGVRFVLAAAFSQRKHKQTAISS